MYPENFFHLIRQKLKKEWIFTFCCALCMGLAFHLYRLTNHLLTWDSVYNFHDSQNTIHLGRCFLTISCGISSYYDLQWVNGLLSLVYLSLTCVCLTEIFSLRKRTGMFLVCSLTVAFPSVAGTFAYMYTADGYFLAQLCAVLAVLATLKYKRGFLPGLLLLAFSYGSYQAYISYAVMIILAWTILQLMQNSLSIRELLPVWIRLLLMGGSGTLLYFLCNRLLTAVQGIAASDYNGISAMSLPDGPGLLLAVKNCIIDFVYFFFGPLDKINFFKMLNGVLFILLFLLLFHMIRKQKLYRKPGALLLIILCFAVMPFVCSMIYFLSPNVRYYMLMYAGFSLIYMLPVLFYDRFYPEDSPLKRGIYALSVNLILAWGCVLVTALNVFNFALIDNISYLYMTSSNEKTFALVSRMVDRIEQLNDFDSAEKLCVIGHFDDYDTISLNLPPAMAGVRDSYLISEQAHFAAMMDTYYGLELENCTEEEQDAIRDSDMFRSMDCWPSTSAIAQIGDTVIIKIADK